MIKIKVKGKIIEVTGHANFADYGKDIVCASVSSIITTTINAILTLEKESISYHDEKEKLIIKIDKETTITKNLISNMLRMLKELEVSYPKNIKILNEEG